LTVPGFNCPRLQALSDDQVAERWLRLFPVRDAERYEARRAALLATIGQPA